MAIQGLILDMDGVLWRGEELIGDPVTIFEDIRNAGLRFVLATNNATRSTAQYQARFSALGIQLADRQVINSAMATASYLRKNFPLGSPLYVIGEEGLRNTLLEAGFDLRPEGAVAVIASLDRQVTYEKLKTAALLIRSGVPFIATNPDRTLPSPLGLVPGAGSIVAALQAATDVPPIVIGKPAANLFQLALERLETSAAETLVVGDRLETDIAGGQAAGCQTAVVLSGVATREAAAAWQPAPDYCEADLASLIIILTGHER